MVARRRETPYPKHFICQEQENDNTQTSEPINNIQTCNDEEKSMGSCNFKEGFEFSLADIKSWDNFIHFMYRPMDPASLGVIRIMFGKHDVILFRTDGSSLGARGVCKLRSIDEIPCNTN
jgi:hypothetical protein